jgi:hypothetical protein
LLLFRTIYYLSAKICFSNKILGICSVEFSTGFLTKEGAVILFKENISSSGKCIRKNCTFAGL